MYNLEVRIPSNSFGRSYVPSIKDSPGIVRMDGRDAGDMQGIWECQRMRNSLKIIIREVMKVCIMEVAHLNFCPCLFPKGT